MGAEQTDDYGVIPQLKVGRVDTHRHTDPRKQETSLCCGRPAPPKRPHHLLQLAKIL